MTRLFGALVASLCCLPSAVANLAPPKDLPREHWELFQQSKAPVSAPHAAEPGVDFVLTADSEVWLDGRPCAYKDLPANAAIVRVEVAPDRKTVIRIEFRSPKRPN